MAGMACAARLSVKGHQVTVLEQAPTWGGSLGWYSREGFSFDTGPSLLTLPAVYRDTFLKTGTALEEVVDLVNVDPVCHYRFADGTEVDVPDLDRRAVGRAFDTRSGPEFENRKSLAVFFVPFVFFVVKEISLELQSR